MKYNLFISLITFLFITVSVTAQDTLTITYTKAAELYVGKLSMHKKVSTNKLVDALGAPSKTVEYPSGEKGLFYKNEGVVFFAKDKLVKGVGINFNWDGDEKFPKESFKGNLVIGDLEITKDTKGDDIAALTAVEFVCPVPIMCASKDRGAKINCMAGFKDQQLTQVVFIVK